MADTQTVTVTVTVWRRGQALRHIPDGARGHFCRYHPVRPGWVVVRMVGGYYMETPASEWEAAEHKKEAGE